MYLFVFAYCSPPLNLFPFISRNPFQALSVVSASCGILLLIEAAILFMLGARLQVSVKLMGIVGIVALGVAMIAHFSTFVCAGIADASPDLIRRAIESSYMLIALYPVVIGICIATVALLFIGIRRHLRLFHQEAARNVKQIGDSC